MSGNFGPPIDGGPTIEPWGSAGGVDVGPWRAGRGYSAGGAISRALPGAGLGNQVSQNAVETFARDRYVMFNGEQIYDVDNVSIMVLPTAVNGWRTLLALRNSSLTAIDIFIAFGVDATTASVFRFEQDEIMQWDTAVPQDDMYVIAASAGARISIAVSQITLPDPAPVESP